MLVLVGALLLGVLAGYATGGRLMNLQAMSMRSAWMVPLALAMQLVAFSGLRGLLGTQLIVPVHLLSYALLLVFVARNVRLPGLALAGLGTALNALVISLNSGYMPASRHALATAGNLYATDTTNNSSIAGAGTRLAFLGDVFAVPKAVPFANVFSIGDVLLALGAAWLLARAMHSTADGARDV